MYPFLRQKDIILFILVTFISIPFILGLAYLIIEFNFNGIGNLIPGFGYQIKIREAIAGFNLCADYINTVMINDLESILQELSSNSDSLLQMNNTIVSLQEENIREEPPSYNISFQESVEIEESLSLEEREKELIQKALKKHNGRRKNAAKELGISERTLYRKIKEFEILK